MAEEKVDPFAKDDRGDESRRRLHKVMVSCIACKGHPAGTQETAEWNLIPQVPLFVCPRCRKLLEDDITGAGSIKTARELLAMRSIDDALMELNGVLDWEENHAHNHDGDGDDDCDFDDDENIDYDNFDEEDFEGLDHLELDDEFIDGLAKGYLEDARVRLAYLRGIDEAFLEEHTFLHESDSDSGEEQPTLNSGSIPDGNIASRLDDNECGEQEGKANTIMWRALRINVRRIYREHDLLNQVSAEWLDDMRSQISSLAHCDGHQLYRRIEKEVRCYMSELRSGLIQQLHIFALHPQRSLRFCENLLSTYRWIGQIALSYADLFSYFSDKVLTEFQMNWHTFNCSLFVDCIVDHAIINSNISEMRAELRSIIDLAPPERSTYLCHMLQLFQDFQTEMLDHVKRAMRAKRLTSSIEPLLPNLDLSSFNEDAPLLKFIPSNRGNCSEPPLLLWNEALERLNDGIDFSEYCDCVSCVNIQQLQTNFIYDEHEPCPICLEQLENSFDCPHIPEGLYQKYVGLLSDPPRPPISSFFNRLPPAHDQPSLDDLVSFIEGNGEVVSAKAAKRARQKQRRSLQPKDPGPTQEVEVPHEVIQVSDLIQTETKPALKPAIPVRPLHEKRKSNNRVQHKAAPPKTGKSVENQDTILVEEEEEEVDPVVEAFKQRCAAALERPIVRQKIQIDLSKL